MPVFTEFYSPDTISEEAKKILATYKVENREMIDAPEPDDLEGWTKLNKMLDKLNHEENDQLVEDYQPTIKKYEMGGTPVVDIKPKNWVDNGKVMVYIHGGAYTFFFAETTYPFPVPMAHDAQLRVISVEYTLAPKKRWQGIVEEVFQVIKTLMDDGYKPEDIAVAGLSAGGGLAAGIVFKLRDEGYPDPGAIILGSPWSDITDTGDTYHTLKDEEPCYLYDKILKPCADAYADPEDQMHPYISPVYGDFSKGFPPTLIQGGTKEIFLSNFVRLYQAIEDGGGYAKLDLYEGMWHVFQKSPYIPEAIASRAKVKKFLQTHINL